MKSLQESLVEEILAVDDISFPSFTTTDRNTPSDCLDSGYKQRNFPSRKYKNSQNAPSIAELENQIIRMRAAVAKSHQKKSAKIQNQSSNSKKHKIKTEASESQTQAYELNSRSSKKRRSSIDNSVYERSSQQESRHKQWKKQKIEQRDSMELSKCTHQPEISQGSRAIAEKIDRKSLYAKQQQNKQHKMQSIKRQSERKALEECVFTPNLNKGRKASKEVNSIEVADFGKKSTQSIFEALYEESKVRDVKNKQKQIRVLSSMVTQPKINPISNQIIGNLNFEQRSKIYQRKKVEKQMIRRQLEEKQNILMHRPKINSYCVSRNPEISIGEHLYSQARKNPGKNSAPKKESIVNKKSAEVYQERKVVAFYQIFKLLDEDQDGCICSQNINLEMLPRQILKIIYPLVDELDAMDVELEEHEFIESLHNLFQTLSIHQRNIILGFTATPKAPDQPSFKPKINARSRQIAQEMHRGHLNISQFCTIREAEKEKQLETERQEKSRREMQKCTFHPQIMTRFAY